MQSAISVTYFLLALLPAVAGATMQPDSTVTPYHWEVTADIGKSVTLGGDWIREYELRVGVGRIVEGWGTFHGFAEYRKLRSTLRRGEINPWIFEHEYPRHDFSASLTVTAAGFFQAGFGGLVENHPQRYYRQPGYGDTTRHMQRGFTNVRFFVLVGFKYDFSPGGGFFIPVGLFFQIYNSLLPSLRAGISKRF